MGPKGKTPWITVNGKKVGDSQICLELLAEFFHKDFSSHLTAEEKSIARAFQIMMEDHLHWYYMISEYLCMIFYSFIFELKGH